MRCSKDLRKRVIEYVQAGGSKSEAARRFNVGRKSVYRWLSPEGLEYKRPGRTPNQGSKLDWKAIDQHVKDFPDLTVKERANHFRCSRNGVWNAMQKMKITRKKNDRV